MRVIPILNFKPFFVSDRSGRGTIFLAVLLNAFLINYSFSVKAGPTSLSQDSLVAKRGQCATWSLTNHLNSAGMFPFTGSVSNSNPSFDMFLIYDNKNFGGNVFKSFDLMDHNTDINYAIVAVHKYFNVGKNLQVTPYIGFGLSQNQSIADKGSDMLADFNVAYKLSSHFTLSNDAILQNLVITRANNWTNRLKLSFSDINFDAAVLLWDRNRLFDNPGYLSTGFVASWNGFKLSSNINMGLSAESILMLQSDTHQKNGFMFSIVCVMSK